MPSYISHAIMGEQLYNEVCQNDSLSKIELSKSEMKGYSLGIDLSLFSKIMKSDPANSLTKDFLISMIQYIKEHKLTENNTIISLLYGHIAHYFLDTNTHPLIYYIEKGTESVGLISNHDLIEGYINSYLSKKILGIDIMDISKEYFNGIDLSNKEASKLLNSTYGQIYGDHQIIKSYKSIMSIFNFIETLKIKSKISKENLIKLSRFDIYLQKNNLSLSEITNETNSIYTNPVTGEKHRESFIQLYYRSIDMTLNAIDKVNRYLYSKYPISILDSIFTGLSYDTGVDLSLGNKMTYVRKKQKTKIICKY